MLFHQTYTKNGLFRVPGLKTGPILKQEWSNLMQIYVILRDFPQVQEVWCGLVSFIMTSWNYQSIFLTIWRKQRLDSLKNGSDFWIHSIKKCQAEKIRNEKSCDSSEILKRNMQAMELNQFAVSYGLYFVSQISLLVIRGPTDDVVYQHSCPILRAFFDRTNISIGIEVPPLKPPEQERHALKKNQDN